MLLALMAAEDQASSPRAALTSLWSAVTRGDEQSIRRLLLVPDDPQQELATAYARLILATRRLGEVTRSKFPDASISLTRQTLLPEDFAKIDQAEVQIDQDQAWLKLPDRDWPIRLIRDEQTWKILVEQPPGATVQHQLDQLAQTGALAEAMNQLADEIAADKYPTAQEAENAVKQRLGSILARSLAGELSATRPATQPD